MNKLLCISLLFLLLPFSTRAGVKADAPSKAVFNVFTYTEKNGEIRNGYGFFISEKGIGVASYALFKDAVRAEVIDAKGNKYKVSRIIGANSTQDLVKFSIEENKGVSALTVAETPAREGQVLSLVNYDTNKKAQPTAIKVEKVQTYNDYLYFEVSAANIDKNFGCPLLNSEGKVCAIVQKNVTKQAKTACAIDARFINGLLANSLGSLNSDLKKIAIPKALPEKEEDALTYIYMLNMKDAPVYTAALNDFVEQHPENPDGYINRARFFADNRQYSLADADFATAAVKAAAPSAATKTDGVHYAYGKLIAEELQKRKDAEQSGWSFDKALSETELAYAENPLPLYLLQKAQCLMLLKRYQDAFETYNQLNKTDFATAETYYAAAQALALAEGDSLLVLEQMDSVVARLEKPYSVQDAQYLYLRALQELRMKLYRKAALDLTEYEKAIGPNNLNHEFYYNKEQTERKAKMWQQALDDIRTAQSKARDDDYYFYRLEEASLQLQVGMYDEAIVNTDDLLTIMPENLDCQKINRLAKERKTKK